jgi:hypothetical protein
MLAPIPTPDVNQCDRQGRARREGAAAGQSDLVMRVGSMTHHRPRQQSGRSIKVMRIVAAGRDMSYVGARNSPWNQPAV